jgi:hypothetical protein
MLSKHLEKAVSENQNDSASISPISEIDANIIMELINVFQLIYYSEISDILDKWKLEGDEIILHKIRYWISQGPAATKIMIKLGDQEFNIQFFQSISLIDSYDNNMHVPIYKIIVNKDDTEKLLFCNLEITFYSYEEREKALNEFKEKTKFLKIKYL